MQSYLVDFVNAALPGLLEDNYISYLSNISSVMQLTIDVIRLMASKSPGISQGSATSHASTQIT